MDTPGGAPRKTNSLLSSLILWAFAGLLALFFLSESVTKFYFAGYVSSNLSHFHDDAECLARGNLPYSRGFAVCVAAKRNTPPEKTTFEYPPATAGP